MMCTQCIKHKKEGVFVTGLHYVTLYVMYAYIIHIHLQQKNPPSRYLGVESRWDPVFILGTPVFFQTNGDGECIN